MTASAENMFLFEKSLHLILIGRTKTGPPITADALTSSGNRSTQSFLFDCSYLITSRVSEREQLRDVALDRD